MDIGEFIARGTIWVSIVGYAAGSVIFALSPSPRRRAHFATETHNTRRTHGELWDSAARVVWTIASASLIAHFISAFQFYHGWSHAAAYRDTARQTEEVFGFNWGGGLFFGRDLSRPWFT